MSPKALTEQPSLLPRDPILDFIAKAYDKPDTVVEVVEKNLRRIIEKFVACQGEFFLFVRRYRDSCRRDMGPSAGLLPPHDFSITITELYLGIISGELRFGEAGTPFHFPIQVPYASGNLYSEPSLLKGDAYIPEIMYGYDVMKWLKEPRKAPDMDQEGLDIAIGDEEVKELIRQYQNSMHKHYGEFPLLAPVCKMGLLLNRLLQDFPEQEALLKKDRKLFAEVWKVMGK